ncbi:hypothetical protein [Roseobacter sp. S98]|uniref:hypothetical protein n=1 Tax=Roseobacter algicola (ex Choi et al. 2025) (nom. illeg.) TaxID=3092138 RepID=UPI0035C6A041
MRKLTGIIAAALISVTLPGASFAGGLTDQSYHGGKHSSGSAGLSAGRLHRDPFGRCPVLERGHYYGDQYCYLPVRALNAPRHPSCPDGFNGFYRGNIFCPYKS